MLTENDIRVQRSDDHGRMIYRASVTIERNVDLSPYVAHPMAELDRIHSQEIRQEFMRKAYGTDTSNKVLIRRLVEMANNSIVTSSAASQFSSLIHELTRRGLM